MSNSPRQPIDVSQADIEAALADHRTFDKAFDFIHLDHHSISMVNKVVILLHRLARAEAEAYKLRTELVVARSDSAYYKYHSKMP